MRQIACIDLETTGLDPVRDRIISIGIVPICPVTWTIGQVEEFIFNPGIPIPQESSNVHGYTNAELVHHPAFEELAHVIYDLVKGRDLAGYNMLSLDLPMLTMEFERAGIKWEPLQNRLLDAGTLFKKREERSLSAAVKFYLGRDHIDAHGAGSDARATAEVLVKQLKWYNLDHLPAERIEPETIYDRPLDVAGKIVLIDDVPTYAFGQKVKGKPVISDIGFAQWMLEKDFHPDTKRVVSKIIDDFFCLERGENDWDTVETAQLEWDKVPAGDRR